MSTSPENRYRLNGELYCLSENCAVDVAITMDVLSRLRAGPPACWERTRALAGQMETALETLKGYNRRLERTAAGMEPRV